MRLSELVSQIKDIQEAAALVGDADPRIFFLPDKRNDEFQIPCTAFYLALDHSEQRTRLILW